jgi:hypothetical protein
LKAKEKIEVLNLSAIAQFESSLASLSSGQEQKQEEEIKTESRP